MPRQRAKVPLGSTKHELAQVGPDFCIVREPLSIDTSASCDIQAELIIEVDGDQRIVVVNLSLDHFSSPRKLHFSPVRGSLAEALHSMLFMPST